MGKGKLAKFAEMETFANVFQAPAGTIVRRDEQGRPVFDDDMPAGLIERGRWREDFFGNANPIVLELGCGRGEYTVGLARMFPEKNFIGVDIKGSRMWHGARAALQEGLRNAAFLRTNIEFIERFFAAGEVDEIWLTFSDPQMKKPTRRLTSTYFLERYRRILRDGGLIHLKTDSRFLFTYTDYVVSGNALPLKFRTLDLYADSLPDDMRPLLNIQTYYEQQWLARGIAIKYMQFQLPQQGALREPDVEIEMDEYRSYNRQKRSGSDTSK